MGAAFLMGNLGHFQVEFFIQISYFRNPGQGPKAFFFHSVSEVKHMSY